MEGGPSIQDADTTILGEDERPRGCFSFFCHPLGTAHRFIVLIFMCFLSFGSYFCYDNPAALQDHIKKDLNLTETQYTALYSVYSWPNVVLNVIGGFLIDRIFGIRLGSNIYVGLTLLGQGIFASGVFFNLYWLMLIGRFIFGIGGESLTVAQNNYAVLWFKGKELNMVFGLQLSFARVGSTVNFLVMESLYNLVLEKNSNGQHVLGIVLFICDRNSWLLGDSGYPQEPWLMTPLGNALPGSPEQRYNLAHIQARNCVERTIGVLKGRFRCLGKILHYRPQKVGCIANACSILHNICVASRVNEDFDIPLPEDDGEIYNGQGDVNGDGNMARRVIIQRYFNN